MQIEIYFEKKELDNICGTDDCHLKIIEKSLDINIKKIHRQPNWLIVNGDNAKQAEDILQDLNDLSEFQSINISTVEMIVENYTQTYVPNKSDNINTPLKAVNMHSHNQRNYVQAIKEKDCTIAFGPERTGKTYLAIACAIEALNDENSNIKRIVITSPYIETNKEVNSHLLNIYEILYELIGFEETTKLLKQNIIEIVSIYYTFRALNDTFIIFDDIRSYHNDDIKPFLTCMSVGSKMVIIIEAGRSIIETIKDLKKKLKEESKISFCHFYGFDIVKKHKLAQLIDKKS
jgi:phosphate starvation-inducible PhoH-like protein